VKCPRDGTTLAKVTIADVELDKCHKCDGIWFDRGEMERLRDAKQSDLEEELEQRYGDPSYEEGDTVGYMRCPRCGDAGLQEYAYTYVNPVRIDRCGQCFGVWLDNDELDAIVKEQEQLEKVEPGPQLRALLRCIGQAFKR